MARNSRLHAPDRPCGLLEPCAATSGKHGSEEGGAGKRRPLSDAHHHIRDVTFGEDNSASRTGSGPANLATIRAAIIAALKDAGYLHVPEGRRDHTTPAEALRLHGLD